MASLQHLEIVSFDPKYAEDFARLNIEWLEKYFVVEPHDAALLEKCEETIINRGGHIFFTLDGETIMGTVALIPMADDVYELGKMAVSEAYQGRKVGQLLLQHCIDFGKEQGWKKLVLYSNTILENAIHIYRKYGFVEVPLEPNSPYLRSNIKMERPQ